VSGGRRPHIGLFPSWNFAPWNHHAAHSILKIDSTWDCRSSTQSFAIGSLVKRMLRFNKIVLTQALREPSQSYRFWNCGGIWMQNLMPLQWSIEFSFCRHFLEVQMHWGYSMPYLMGHFRQIPIQNHWNCAQLLTMEYSWQQLGAHFYQVDAWRHRIVWVWRYFLKHFFKFRIADSCSNRNQIRL